MENTKENTENPNQEEAQQELQHDFPDLLSDMTGYDHLYVMCKHIRNESSSGQGFANPITPRLQYIMDALAYQGIPFEFMPLQSDWGVDDHSSVSADDSKLANVMVKFSGNGTGGNTVIFTAHHDIANPNSENCQDNTASVCNLLHLCSKLKAKAEKGLLQQDVVIGFTDCEEIGGRGMNKLIFDIKNNKYGEVEAIYCLELTANGTEFWVQGLNSNGSINGQIVGTTTVKDRIEKATEFSLVSTPYNESVNARRENLPAVCIGTLSEEEMEIVKSSRYCSTWGLCHSMADTFERSANKEEMTAFVNTMVKMVDCEEETIEDATIIEETNHSEIPSKPNNDVTNIKPLI